MPKERYILVHNAHPAKKEVRIVKKEDPKFSLLLDFSFGRMGACYDLFLLCFWSGNGYFATYR